MGGTGRLAVVALAHVGPRGRARQRGHPRGEVLDRCPGVGPANTSSWLGTQPTAVLAGLRDHPRELDRPSPGGTRDAAAARLPADVYEQAGTAHYGDAVRSYLGDLPAGPLLVTHEGMSGGYLGIEAAREFVRAELLRPPHVAADLYRISRALRGDRLVVAMHVRRGDFGATPPRPGQFNAALPMSWYRGIAKQIEGAFPGRVTTLVLSDDPRISRRGGFHCHCPAGAGQASAVRRAQLGRSGPARLLRLELLDAGSVPFERPVHLVSATTRRRGGGLSIWGDEPGYGRAATARNRQRSAERRSRGRGIPLDADEPLPDELLRNLDVRLRQRDSSADLLRFGVVPARSPSN